MHDAGIDMVTNEQRQDCANNGSQDNVRTDVTAVQALQKFDEVVAALYFLLVEIEPDCLNLEQAEPAILYSFSSKNFS